MEAIFDLNWLDCNRSKLCCLYSFFTLQMIWDWQKENSWYSGWKSRLEDVISPFDLLDKYRLSSALFIW